MILHQIPNSYGNYNYNAHIYKKVWWDSHFHANYELVYGVEGTSYVGVNGTEFLLEEGELMLISPYSIHSLRGEENSRIWVGVFSEDFIVSFAEKNRFVNFSKFRCGEATEQFLRQTLFHKGRPEHYLLISSLYMVLSECVKNGERSDLPRDDGFMYRVICYISDHLSQDITMQEMAREMRHEYHYFSSLFHSCFCMNFRSFINMFRFESACKLLQNQKESITDVCEKCGFGSIRNFNRVFKQLAGITPGAYRKSCGFPPCQ